jgi:protein-tyrosine-phosphatase
LAPGRGNIESMKKFDINISKKKRKQVSMSTLKNANKIVILMEKSEFKEHLPFYLKKFKNKTIFWSIKDMRSVKSNKTILVITKKIKQKVEDLVRRVG